MVTVKSGVLGIVALIACSTGLKADIFTETVNGTVLSTGTSPDNAGAFGGGSLIGDTMKITFMFNLSQFLMDGTPLDLNTATSETLSNTDTVNAVLTHTIVDTTKNKTFNETNITPGANGLVQFEISAIPVGATIDPGGTLLDSLIGGAGSEIKIYSTAAFPGGILRGPGAQAFLDQLAADATYMTIGIDADANGRLETDIALDGTPPMTQTPEPASVVLLVVVVLACGYKMRTRNAMRSL
jgi:hypothetical protein